MKHLRYLKMANYQLRNQNVVLVNDLAVHRQLLLDQAENPKQSKVSQENTGIPRQPPARIRGCNIEKRPPLWAQLQASGKSTLKVVEVEKRVLRQLRRHTPGKAERSRYLENFTRHQQDFVKNVTKGKEKTVFQSSYTLVGIAPIWIFAPNPGQSRYLF